MKEARAFLSIPRPEWRVVFINGKIVNIRKKIANSVCLSSIISFCMMMCAYWVLSFAPFGNHSAVSMDANIQYIDFLAYLKDVFHGENSIYYTFGKSLGGTAIADFAYYLASPFNLLLVFFDKADLLFFFNLVIALKVAACALTCSIYLHKRFDQTLKPLYTMVISMGYALCQYNLAQSSNVMWLDGVIMLPLILLGVYRSLENRVCSCLVITVAISLVTNWYVGAINCVFSAFWLIFEIALSQADLPLTLKQKTVKTAKTIGYYGLSMVFGIMISCALFFPVVIALKGGSGAVDFKGLLNPTLRGELCTVVEGLAVGQLSTGGSVSLFCGSFITLGCFGFFVTKKNIGKVRSIAIMAMIIIVLMLYWNPFYWLFSLLRDVTSFFCRFSYVAICGMTAIAALYFSLCANGDTAEDAPERFDMLRSVLLFVSLLLFFCISRESINLTHVFVTAICSILIALCVTLLPGYTGRGKALLPLVLVGIVVAELFVGTTTLLKNYLGTTEDYYGEYMRQGEEQINELKAYDSSVYRISQTSTRMGEGRFINLTANYNEALALNYMSIAGYSSAYDSKQAGLLDRAGYRQNVCMNTINTSILPIDSLLGVKYVLSRTPIEGLLPVEGMGTFDGKEVYVNPYCLPMAFVCAPQRVAQSTPGNPFEYQNELYSCLLGRKVDLFVPVSFEITQSGNVAQGLSQIYNVCFPEDGGCVYGNIRWSGDMQAVLRVGERYETSYSCWLSPSVFFVGNAGSEESINVELHSDIHYSIDEAQFYTVDLELLKNVTERLAAQAPTKIEIENGHAQFQVDGQCCEFLFTSIKQNVGWDICVNGKQVDNELLGDFLYLIPLDDGTNTVEMTYHIPYLPQGIIISLVGFVLWLFCKGIERTKRGLSRNDSALAPSNVKNNG